MATQGEKMDETCYWALPDVHGMMGDLPGHVSSINRII